jgi:hypothetical protein
MPFLWVATNKPPQSKLVNNGTCSKRLLHELPVELRFTDEKPEIQMLQTLQEKEQERPVQTMPRKRNC